MTAFLDRRGECRAFRWEIAWAFVEAVLGYLTLDRAILVEIAVNGKHRSTRTAHVLHGPNITRQDIWGQEADA